MPTLSLDMLMIASPLLYLINTLVFIYGFKLIPRFFPRLILFILAVLNGYRVILFIQHYFQHHH